MRLVPLLLLLSAACRATLPTPGDTGTPVEEDLDGDGFSAEVDCNDADALVFPGATELCNGIDDDCSGIVDDNTEDSNAWYVDNDGDGYGNELDTVMSCADPGEGYTTESGDCDDADNDIHPGADELCNGEDDDCDGEVDNDPVDGDSFYVDLDGDGYGDPAQVVYACELGEGLSERADDCDDTRAEAFPGADELCNELDDDCDGDIDDNALDTTVFYADADGDGWGTERLTTEACAAPAGFVATSGDCDDASEGVFPDADELCNSQDDDCDGVPDEDAIDQRTWFTDSDGDGFGDVEAPVLACEVPEGAVGNSADCDDSAPRVHPLGTELCNGIDDDCSGLIDDDPADPNRYWTDADADGYGASGTPSTEACEAPDGFVGNARDCADDNASVSPAAEELCNELDDDCDGEVDELAVDALTFYGDGDRDGFGAASVSTAACEAPDGFVSDDSDCDDGDALAFPGADERCNDADDDCDGAVDEDPIDPTAWYADADGDGYGSPDLLEQACDAPDGFVASSTDCDDDRRLTFPGAPETCNEIDDDCDGVLDNDPIDGLTAWPDSDGDGYGDGGSDPVQVCDLDGYADNADDCDPEAADEFPGSSAACPLDACPQGDGGVFWVAPTGDEPFEATCDADGWMLVGRLAAGSRDQGSVYRGERFLSASFVQGTSSYTTAPSNGDVLLDSTNFGLLDASAMWDDASELRFSCVDETRGHSASAVLDLAAIDRDTLLYDTTYDSNTTPVQFSYDGAAASTSDVHLTWSNQGYWGSWHICGAGNAAQGSSSEGWQLGFCHNGPGQSDSNVREVAQIAIGYHPGFTGIRLECGNDTPSNTAHIEGHLALWLR